jgi:hypothetical protein
MNHRNECVRSAFYAEVAEKFAMGAGARGGFSMFETT